MSCEVIMRRKLFCGVAALICGIVFLDRADRQQAVLWLGAAAFFMTFAVFTAGKKDRRQFFRIFILGFAAGCILLAAAGYRAEHSPCAFRTGQTQEIKAIVSEIEKKDEESYRILCLAGREKILCSYYKPLYRYWRLVGREIVFDAAPQVPRGAGNPRTFDYRRYLQSEGIRYTAVISKFSLTGGKANLWGQFKSFVLGKRNLMIEAMKLPEEDKAFLEGALFGNTAGLDEETYEDFRRNGTSHILAVSGLHVGMLYGIFRQIYKRKKSPALVFLFLMILFLYGTAALWSISVSRAVLLILLAMGGDFLQRRYDLLTALAAAAFLAIVRNPYVIFGTSFQMSFLAVLSMCFLTPVLKKIMKESAAAVFSVQLGLMPYMAYTFNYVSLTGVFCNIPVVFLTSILVPIGAAAFFCFLATGRMLPQAPEVLGGLAEIVVKINHLFSEIPFADFDVVSPPLWLLLGFYAVIFFLSSEYGFVCLKRKEKGVIRIPVLFLCLFLAFGSAAGQSPFDRADVVFLDVGQGDSIHIKGVNHKHILVDGGGSKEYNIGKKVLKPYFLKNGISNIDIAAATHLHTDHYLGLTQLQEAFPIKNLVIRGQAGDILSLGKDSFVQILWPEKRNPDTEDENLNSLIFKVRINGLTVLLTGDLTAEGEEMLVRRYAGTDALQADVLKISHHGSAYSTCDSFLAAVKPSVAIISVGKNNYGHPSNLIIEKLENLGIMVYRTDLDGAVGIKKRRGKISVCTENP